MSPVHVALDALALGPQPAGVGRYVLTLLAGLRELPSPPAVTVVARASARPALAASGLVHPGDVTGPGPLASRAPLRLLWEQLLLPRLARRRGAGVVHGLMGVVPLRARVPAVVTIHDVTFLTHPGLHARRKVAWFRAALPLAARAARLVLTDSEASRGEILARLPCPPERVRVVPLAVDPVFRPPGPDEVEQARRRFGLAGEFVLYAGVLEPRKNLPRLVAAVERLRARGLPHRLVLAGKAGWRRAPLEQALARAGGAVVRLGWVRDEDLRALLGAAAAFAYVPVAEGFGLPVAEALACGAPVLTSAASSLPEVAGGAARLADPESVDDLARALEALLTEGGQEREERRRRGLAQAARLSPRRLAEGTRRAWEEAAGSEPGVC